MEARPAALVRVEAAQAGLAGGLPALLASVQQRGRVTLNFHPDRLLSDGRTVAAAMTDDGRYLSQFVTGVSSGSRTAWPGGDRDRWEERLFGGVYQADGVRADERPTYGALDLIGHADGASPRFGSCHLRLRPEALERCSFCFRDSHLGPSDLGTIDTFEPLLAALIEEVTATGAALGRAGLDAPSLLALLRAPPAAVGSPGAARGRALDDYIEAQFHGPLVLSEQVEWLVADPSFRGTEIEAQLSALCSRHGVGLAWHPGYELPVEQVPDDFRGPAMRPLAHRLLREFSPPRGLLDAALIGRAAASLERDPARWLDRGPVDETRQHLKQLWHVLVRFG